MAQKCSSPSCQKAEVSVDALANYMAFRLSLRYQLVGCGYKPSIRWNFTPMYSSRHALEPATLLSSIQLTEFCFSAPKTQSLGSSEKLGSGKSTFSEELANGLGWPRASFGDFLRNVAKSRDLEESREVLQELGESFIERGPNEFCRAVVAPDKWNSGEPLIIGGIDIPKLSKNCDD